MQLLSATFHAPERHDRILALPPLDEGGWSFSIVGDNGQGVFHGAGNPRGSAIFDGLLRQSAQAGCAIALTGPKIPKVRQRHHEGRDWAFAALRQTAGDTMDELLKAASDKDDPTRSLAAMIRRALGRVPEFVLCNGRDSFVFSRGGLFMSGAISHYDSGAHPTVQLSTTPFGDHLWERLQDGSLLHFVDGCEARRVDTGLRLAEPARRALQAAILQRSAELAQRNEREERLLAASWWSG